MSKQRTGVARQYTLLLPAQTADAIKAIASANKLTENEVIEKCISRELNRFAAAVEQAMTEPVGEEIEG